MSTLGLGLESLLVIVVVAYLAPYVASLIPGKPIPEAVFLVFAGALLGPHGITLIDSSLDSVQLLSQLGCAFLFLMAGYEIDVKQVTGPMGKHASLTWVISLIIAGIIVPFLPLGDTDQLGRWAFALAMTTTAFGTLAPIMRDRGLTGTAVGDVVTAYGATGEILPVLAMGILLSTGGTWMSITSIIVYVLICLFVLWRTKRMKAKGTGVARFIGANAENGAQATVRASVLLLVFLVTMANDLKLDIVVGAFAAGFILRALMPRGNKVLEGKLEGISFGFFVPLFFVVSGTTIDLAAVGENPLLFVSFIGLLLLVRALPIIVAVTSVAVDAGAMTESMASVLVTGGAFTVIAVPVITSLTRVVEASHPVLAMQEIAAGSENASVVWEAHLDEQRRAIDAFRAARTQARARGRRLSSADFLATRGWSPTPDGVGKPAAPDDPVKAAPAPAEKEHFHGLGFLRFVEVWFVLVFLVNVLALLIKIFDHSIPFIPTDAVTVFAAVSSFVGLVCIMRRKKQTRALIITLCTIGIVAEVARKMLLGTFGLEDQLLVSLPDLLLIIYFATSRRVRATLDR